MPTKITLKSTLGLRTMQLQNVLCVTSPVRQARFFSGVSDATTTSLHGHSSKPKELKCLSLLVAQDNLYPLAQQFAL